MTFAARAQSFYYGYVNPPGALSATISGAAAPRSITIQVRSSTSSPNQASISLDTGGGGGASTVPSSGIAPWYLPYTGAPSSMWARLTVTAGTSPTSGDAVGSWVGFASSTANWIWTRSVAGTTTATVTLELSTDSGGSTIVMTQTGLAISVGVV